MNTQIINIDNLDTQHLSLGTPKKNSSGSHTCEILYEGEKFLLKLPSMPLAFKINDYNGNGQFKMCPKLAQGTEGTHTALESMDKWLIEQFSDVEINQLLGSSKNKPYSHDVVESKCKSILHFSKDKSGETTTKYPPYINISIPIKNGEFTADFYDLSLKPIHVDTSNIKNNQRFIGGTEVTSLVYPVVWINSSNGAGFSFYLQQCKVGNKVASKEEKHNYVL